MGEGPPQYFTFLYSSMDVKSIYVHGSKIIFRIPLTFPFEEVLQPLLIDRSSVVPCCALHGFEYPVVIGPAFGNGEGPRLMGR